MKNYVLNTPVETEINETDAKLAEMFLDAALLNFRKEQIRKEINRALDKRNKEEFMQLTEKLKNIV